MLRVGVLFALGDYFYPVLPDRVTWSEAAEGAFATLRRALCTEPILITPDFSLPLIVPTDASEVGLGAVLSQVRAGEEHPVTYISRKLLSNERNYSTVEKEALAIKWALDKLRYISWAGSSRSSPTMHHLEGHKCKGDKVVPGPPGF